jgi:hypothetical protein
MKVEAMSLELNGWNPEMWATDDAGMMREWWVEASENLEEEERV